MWGLAETYNRTELYLRYLVAVGMIDRYGPGWETTERTERLRHELSVIEENGFSAAFIMLADVLDFCRRERIPSGPGRGSVGGSYVAYAVGIHEVDSLEWGLLFERFLNPARVSFPDVDIDVSQAHRARVVRHIIDTHQQKGQAVLQVGAFVRAGARAVIDLVLAARAQSDPDAAYAVATTLKRCLPETGNVTGGVKVARELSWWIENGHGDKEGFQNVAREAGWLEDLLLLDGMFTHLGRHAAGVVILGERDLANLPLLSIRDQDGESVPVTGYDMYALDDLGYLKWDVLGLRTLDVLAEAHRFAGGSGETRDLLALWRAHRDDPDVHALLSDADTVGIFQMETDGYRRTLRAFQPTTFTDIVHLNALYRPGALGFREQLPDGSEGRNMVEMFIDRRHGREAIDYSDPRLQPILESTNGVLLFQEQTMRIARELAGFSLAQADQLRKAIGKKRPEEMAALMPLWQAGTADLDPAVRDAIWRNIEASARYSWNQSHCLAQDTPILTERGWVPIQDVKPGDIAVSGENGLFRQRVHALHDNGVRQTYRVILEDGVEICGTDNHRLLTEKGYKRIDDMRRGDALKVSYDFSPRPGVQVLAARVTHPTESHEIPAWIVFYDGERDDVVDWQLFVVDTTNTASPTIALANGVFRSRVPRVDRVTAPNSPWSPESMFETRASVLDGLEPVSFFTGTQNGSQKILDGGRVESQAVRDFRTGKLFFKIESSSLFAHGRSELSNNPKMTGPTVLSEEAHESLSRTFQSQNVTNLRISPAFGVEIQDLLPSLFQILDCYGPHADIVTHSRTISKIEAGTVVPVYDLEMPGPVHNFVASGILSHNSVAYAMITCLCAILKAKHRAAFYAAEINSWESKKERQVSVIEEARRRVQFRPPDINLAEDKFIVDAGDIVFGLNGIKGMGRSTRNQILAERVVGGDFASFEEFCGRLPSVPVNIKRSLVACGAFDMLGARRELLLAEVPRGNPRWQLMLECGCEPTKNSKVQVGAEVRCAKCRCRTAVVATQPMPRKSWQFLEQLNENAKRQRDSKPPLADPNPQDMVVPTAVELGTSELAAIGYFITAAPLQAVSRALDRVQVQGTIGGEVSAVKWRTDRNGNDYADLRLTLPDLTHQRVLVFHSGLAQHRDKIEPRAQLLFRGKRDGDTFIANSCWVAGDYRHFLRVELRNTGGQKEVRPFDGSVQTIERLEAEGFTVTCV